jgi:carboxymethylenebutenolidase
VVNPAGVSMRFGQGRTETFGYLAEVSQPRAGVVVAHDWYGHLPHLRQRCDALAKSGMMALAPDLYGGQLTADDFEAERLFRALDVELARERLVEAVAHLRRLGAERIGLLGFSMGGWLELLVATVVSVEAVTVYYATLEADEWSPIGCPVQFHFAETDVWEPPELPAAFAEWLIASGTPVETFEYPGSRHGFANSDVPPYRPGSAELAWARTVRFLGGHLMWRPP